ncbi:MAG TPA: hypothetical protein VMT85_24870 [Thermoanaerobaculia bacterium]|nr:hypothetical protein [Thermoanaerobaculia bacterium]
MTRRLLLLRVALLVTGLLLLGLPAAAAGPDSSVGAPVAGVGAPEPIPDHDAPPPQPRFTSSQRSTLAEAPAGPQPFLHPAAVRCIERSGPQALDIETGAAREARSQRALFLVLCSFLN